MTTENLPCAEPVVVVFDIKGKRIDHALIPTLVIEPENMLSNDTASGLNEHLHKLVQKHATTPAIGIKFAKFADGRAYSIASRLREAGYKGELHALGDINQELMFMIKRVGFSHAHIPDPGVSALPKSIIDPFSGYYQAALDGSHAPWQTTRVR